MGRSQEFEKQTEGIVLPKFEQAGQELMSGHVRESESILSSIPEEFLMRALGIALSYIGMQEDKNTQRLFLGLKIVDKLNSLINPNSPKERAFSIWAASEEEMNKHWNNFSNLRELFRIKENSEEFNKHLDQMTLHEVVACGEFSTVYMQLSTLKPHTDPNSPNNRVNLETHLGLTSALIRKAFVLKAKSKDM